jgi:hypothetical protein
VTRRRFLPAVDALALVLFVVVGIREHLETAGIALFLRDAVPLLAAWFAVARATGAYRRPGVPTLLRTWAIGVPVGLLARTAWVGSPTGARLLVFVGVGLTFTLLFLLVGRYLARALAPAAAPEGPGVVR